MDTVLLGQGMTAYGPLRATFIMRKMWSITTIIPERQRKFYRKQAVKRKQTVFIIGTEKKVGFVLNVAAGDQDTSGNCPDSSPACFRRLESR